jgi:predicted glycosyltransferase
VQIMKVLVDIVHPADVLFFKRPIEAMLARGDELRILSRAKDVAGDLLDRFRFEHTVVSRVGRGMVGLGFELLRRDFAVLRVARRFRPDVMTGFGGVAVAHVGALLGIPSCAFYDSETARLQTRLAWPFISHLTVPESYRGPVPSGRTAYIPGTKELSFLHPAVFRPDPAMARAAGWQQGCDNFLVRIVAWHANHDLGKAGLDPALVRVIVHRLSSLGKVHISAEGPLPGDLEPYAFRGDPGAIHHLMAHCRLLVGESATMAAECAMLGVPAIYAGHDFPGYILELEAAGLVANVPAEDRATIPERIDSLLHCPAGTVAAARDAYVARCPDWAAVVVDTLDRLGAAK